MTQRPTFDRPIAHRGLHNRAEGVIENSRSAFERAISGGFHIECDVQLSSDGIPLIFHDDELERLTGLHGLVSSLTAAELSSTPLLGSAIADCPQQLTDFLLQIGGRTLIQLELKRQPNATMTDSLARTAAAAIALYRGPLVVESFDPNLLVLIRKYGYRGALGIITYRYDDPEWEAGLSNRDRNILRHLMHWPWTRFHFISCAWQSLDLPAVKFFRTLGFPVTSWTIRTPDQKRAALRGADQIVFEGFDPQSA